METLENRAHTGVDVMSFKDTTFSEAMLSFLEANQINHDLLAPNSAIESVIILSQDGKSSKVQGCTGGTVQEVFAKKVFAKLERYVRYGSRILPIETHESYAPHRLIGATMRVVASEHGWALARLPELADLSFAAGEEVRSDEMVSMMTCARNKLAA